MNNTKNRYIKYTRQELENYTKLDESCVRKVNTNEPIRFSPTILATFKSSIQRILSKKIGKFDVKLNGVVLDFKNTKVLGTTSTVRGDSPFATVKVETNFYVFAPFKGAVVTGVVKYINWMQTDTIISVIIYRVFNVKVTVKGQLKSELQRNQEIQIRVTDFHFDNVIPFIEGEIIDSSLIVQRSSKKLFEDTANDSGISESSNPGVLGEKISSAVSRIEIRVKQERESSVESTFEQKRKSRKRRTSEESVNVPVLKKIKSEPLSTNIEESQSTPKTTFMRNITAESASTKSSDVTITASMPKESRKKKKKSKEVDFETSLQLLMDSCKSIKKEF